MISKLKYKKILIVAILLLLAVAGTITILTVTSGDKVQQASKQLSLGEKYLSELEYENAIIAFNKVIEIEPMNMKAYIGLAAAYEGLGQTEDAMEVLEAAIIIIKDTNEDTKEVLDNSEDVYIKLAELYVNKGYNEKSFRILLEGYDLTDSNTIAKLLKDYFPEIEASVKPGTYAEAQLISLISKGNKIYYTLDGSEPTKESEVFVNPIEVCEGRTTLKAVVENEYGELGEIKLYSYIINHGIGNKVSEEDIDISDVETNFYMIDYAKVLRFIYMDASYTPEVYLNDTNDDGIMDLLTPSIASVSVGRMSFKGNKVRIRLDAHSGAAGHANLKYNKKLDTYAIDMAYSSIGVGNSVLKICSGLDWKGSEAKMTYIGEYSENLNQYVYQYTYHIDDNEVTSEIYSQATENYKEVFGENCYNRIINHFVECDDKQIPKIYEAYAEYAQKQNGYIGWSNSININNTKGAMYVFSYNCKDELESAKGYLCGEYEEEDEYYFPEFYSENYSYDYRPILVIAEPVANGVNFHTVVLKEAFHFDAFEFDKDVLTLSSAEAIRRYSYSPKVIEFGSKMFTYEGETELLSSVQVSGDMSRLGNNQGNMQSGGNVCYDVDFMYIGTFNYLYRFDSKGSKTDLMPEKWSYWFHDLCNLGNKLIYIKRKDISETLADYYICYLDKSTGESVILKEINYVNDTSILNTLDGKVYYSVTQNDYNTTTTYVYDTKTGTHKEYLNNGQLMTEKGIYYTIKNESDSTIMFRSFDDNRDQQIIQIDAVPKVEINDYLYLVGGYHTIYKLDLNNKECIKVVESADYIFCLFGYGADIIWGDNLSLYLSDLDGNNTIKLISEDIYSEYSFIPCIVRDRLAIITYYEGEFYSIDYVNN